MSDELCIIMVNESDRIHHKPVVDFIIREALHAKLRGATAFRAIDGFGAHLRIHHATLLSMTDDEGVAILIADSSERLEAFLAQLGAAGVQAATVRVAATIGHLGPA
jgi:PII-like signaling protein